MSKVDLHWPENISYYCHSSNFSCKLCCRSYRQHFETPLKWILWLQRFYFNCSSLLASSGQPRNWNWIFGPPIEVAISAEMEIRNVSTHLSQSQNSNSQYWHFLCGLYTWSAKIAKLSPNFSFSWAEMDFILNFPHPPSHPREVVIQPRKSKVSIQW